MDAVELHHLAGILDALLSVLGIVVIVKRNAAAEAQRQIHLSDLVILGHVGIKVVLAIPDHGGRSRTTEQESGKDGAFDGEFVQHRESSGKAETSRAGVRIGLVGERGFAPAKHLGAGFDLAMNLESDGDDVFCNWHGGVLNLKSRPRKL